MAHIEKLKVRYPIQVLTSAVIRTVYENSTKISLNVTGNTVSARYKFIVSGEGDVPGSMSCAVYKNSTHLYNRSISTPFGNGIEAFGTYNNIIDSIDINITVPMGLYITTTEDVYVDRQYYSTSPVVSPAITVGDLFAAGIDEMYKVVVRDGSGDHVVYQEQLAFPAAPTYNGNAATSLT